MRTFDFAVLPHETAFASVLHMHKRLASQQRKHHREELHTDHRPTVRSFGKKGKKGSVTSLLHFGQLKLEGEFTYFGTSSIETALVLGSSPPSCFRLPAQVPVLQQQLATNSLQKRGVPSLCSEHRTAFLQTVASSRVKQSTALPAGK